MWEKYTSIQLFTGLLFMIIIIITIYNLILSYYNILNFYILAFSLNKKQNIKNT